MAFGLIRGLSLETFIVDTRVSEIFSFSPPKFQARTAILPDALLPVIFKEDCLSEEQMYATAKAAFIATSIVGGLTMAVSALTGMPLPALAGGAALLAGGGGAFFTDKAISNLEEQRRITAEMGKRITELSFQVDAFSTQNGRLTRQVDVLTVQNGQFRANVDTLTAQNEQLRQSVESLNGQITQLSIQNESFRTLGEQFGAYLEQFRQGIVLNRDEFARKIQEFTQQLAASRDLWAQVLQSASTVQGNYAAQLTRLTELVGRLSDPRNTLTRLQEHQEINRHIQEATQRLTHLSAQIALREGQLRERDQLLVELRTAHRQILSDYGSHNTALAAQIDRICGMLGQTLTTDMEVTIPYDVGFGNTLGIRAEPNWNESVRFTHTPAGWKGQVPLGKAFKFVLILAQGEVRWEKGENRYMRESSRAQQEVATRRIEL